MDMWMLVVTIHARFQFIHAGEQLFERHTKDIGQGSVIQVRGIGGAVRLRAAPPARCSAP